jgi:hypothetical protein
MRRQRPTRTIALLTVVIGVLAILNVVLLQSPVDISPLDQANGNSRAWATPNLDLSTPLDDKPAAMFQEMVGRPLFNPSRRPPTQEAMTTDAENTPPSELRLVGVMKSGDSYARALIRSANGQPGRWIAEGEQFDGWTLRKIGERSVTVDAGGRPHELSLAPRRRASDEDSETGDNRR